MTRGKMMVDLIDFYAVVANTVASMPPSTPEVTNILINYIPCSKGAHTRIQLQKRIVTRADSADSADK